MRTTPVQALSDFRQTYGELPQAISGPLFNTLGLRDVDNEYELEKVNDGLPDGMTESHVYTLHLQSGACPLHQLEHVLRMEQAKLAAWARVVAFDRDNDGFLTFDEVQEMVVSAASALPPLVLSSSMCYCVSDDIVGSKICACDAHEGTPCVTLRWCT
jgi:hypothetical protein